MTIGRVVGFVELQRTMPGTEGLKWKQVLVSGEAVVALDPVGAHREDLVLLSRGEGAWRMCPEAPVDAVILGVLKTGNNG